MRGRRPALVLALLAAVLLPGGLWLAPRLTDWTARRDVLAQLAADRLGLPVALSGPVRLVLLPRPMLEAEGVTVGGADDASGFGARALRLRLDGWSLLAGRLSPRALTLVGADIRLPWPPAPGAAFPTALASFEAEVVDARLTLGALPLERVRARLSTAGPAEALRVGGSFVPASLWPGREVRFEATLGRPGPDGAAPLDLSLAAAGATLAARGVLAPGGGLEGRIEAAGPDLSLLLPTPAGPFAARGRLAASAEAIEAGDLALDLAGSTVRGVLTLRLQPGPRLDAALLAGRLELEPWIAALSAPAGPGTARLPFGLDLSAEAADWRGVTLRRLRASVFREGERLSLTDVSALLPGDTAVELSGATAGSPGAERLEAMLRFGGADLRAALAALGWPLPGLAADRLRRGEGRARLVLEAGQVALPEIAATLDGTRLSGAGVVRGGARPALGLGLTLDALDLDGLWTPGRAPREAWAEASRTLGLLDANLRVAVGRLTLGGVVAERAGLDAGLENGRLSVRRLDGHLAGADVTASGTALLGPQPHLVDLALELAAPDPRPLLALLPGDWPDGARIAADPLSLRLSVEGAPDALALRAEADWSDLRLEGAGTADLAARRGAGSLTLRHPGAPRLLEAALGPGAGRWLGDGSLSLVMGFGVGAGGLSAERFELVAGGLRAGGQLALSPGRGTSAEPGSGRPASGPSAPEGPAPEGQVPSASAPEPPGPAQLPPAPPRARPRLTGRIVAENLPLPAPDRRGPEPLPFAALRALDAGIALAARRVEAPGLPPVEEVEASLRLEAGALRLDLARGRLSGGALAGTLGLDASGAVPLLSAEATLEGAEVTGPLTGLPLDLTSGRLDLSADLDARGSSLAALLATLAGEATLSARAGVLTGLDAGAVRAATGAGTEAALRAALQGGATPFDALSLRARLSQGVATIVEARLPTEDAVLSATGQVDLGRAALDALLSVGGVEADTDEPAPGVRLSGPLARPRRAPELAAWLRWRAARGG